MTITNATPMHWALDFWARPEHHMTHVRQTLDVAGDTEHRAVCSCGWQSIPVVWASDAYQERCPVLEALQERAKRKDRP